MAPSDGPQIDNVSALKGARETLLRAIEKGPYEISETARKQLVTWVSSNWPWALCWGQSSADSRRLETALASSSLFSVLARVGDFDVSTFLPPSGGSDNPSSQVVGELLQLVNNVIVNLGESDNNNTAGPTAKITGIFESPVSSEKKRSLLAYQLALASKQDLEKLDQPYTLLEALSLHHIQFVSCLLSLATVSSLHILSAIQKTVQENYPASLLQILLSHQSCPHLDPKGTLIPLIQTAVRTFNIDATRLLLEKASASHKLLLKAIGLQHVVYICSKENELRQEAAARMLEFLLSKKLSMIVEHEDIIARIVPLDEEDALNLWSNLMNTCYPCYNSRIRLDKLSKHDALGLALCRASWRGNVHCVRVLLECGVPVEWKGNACLKMAEMAHQEQVIVILKESMEGLRRRKWWLISDRKRQLQQNQRREGGDPINEQNKIDDTLQSYPPVAATPRITIVDVDAVRHVLSAMTSSISGSEPPASESKRLEHIPEANEAISTIPEIFKSSDSELEAESFVTTPEIHISNPSLPANESKVISHALNTEEQVVSIESTKAKPVPMAAENIVVDKIHSISQDDTVSQTPDLLRESAPTPDSAVEQGCSSDVFVPNVVVYTSSYKTKLTDLPDKIIHKIILRLQKQDMTVFTSTSKRLSTLCTSIEFMASYILHALPPRQALLNVVNTPYTADRQLLLSALLDAIPKRQLASLAQFFIESKDCSILNDMLPRIDPAFHFGILKKCVQEQSVEGLEVVLAYALESGADGIITLDPNAENGVLLSLAVVTRNMTVVDVLLNWGANPTAGNHGALRELCLNASATIPNTEIAKTVDRMAAANIASKLVLAGADVSVNEYEPLKSAAESGDAELLKVLLRETVGNGARSRRSTMIGAIPSPVISPQVHLLPATPLKLEPSPLFQRTPSLPPHPPPLSHHPSLSPTLDHQDPNQQSVIQQIYMTCANYGYSESLQALLAEPRTWNFTSTDGTSGVQANVCPAALEAITRGWVNAVRVFSESKCWIDVVKLVGGNVLLDRAARYSIEADRTINDETNGILRVRKLAERPIVPVDGDIIIPHAAAMVESMVAGVAGSSLTAATARFTAFETTIMKKGIDAHSFLNSAKPNDRESPFHKIKDAILLQAVWLGHESVMDAVISVLQPDLTGNSGLTVLITAVTLGYTKIVAALISCGVDFEAGEGMAFDIAQDRGHSDTLKHLKLMRAIRVTGAKDAEAKAKDRAKKRQTTRI